MLNIHYLQKSYFVIVIILNFESYLCHIGFIKLKVGIFFVHTIYKLRLFDMFRKCKPNMYKLEVIYSFKFLKKKSFELYLFFILMKDNEAIIIPGLFLLSNCGNVYSFGVLLEVNIRHQLQQFIEGDQWLSNNLWCYKKTIKKKHYSYYHQLDIFNIRTIYETEWRKMIIIK